MNAQLSANDGSGLAVVLLAWRDDAEALTQAGRIMAWRNLQPTVYLVRNEPQTPPPAPQPGLVVVDCPHNTGYAGGINAAWRVLGENIVAVLLLNNDALMTEQDAQRLVHFLKENPKAGVVGPVLMEGGRRCVGGKNPLVYTATRRFAQDDEPSDGHWEADYVPGTAAMIRADALRSAGLLDDRFFFSGEMADFCHRVRQAGWRCVVLAGASATHHAADASGLRDTLYRYYTLRNRFLMARIESPRFWVMWAVYWSAIGLMMGARDMRKNRPAARAIRRALGDGWRGRFGNQHHHFVSP